LGQKHLDCGGLGWLTGIGSMAVVCRTHSYQRRSDNSNKNYIAYSTTRTRRPRPFYRLSVTGPIGDVLKDSIRLALTVDHEFVWGLKDTSEAPPIKAHKLSQAAR
jgi:hypothetical protein